MLFLSSKSQKEFINKREKAYKTVCNIVKKYNIGLEASENTVQVSRKLDKVFDKNGLGRIFRSLISLRCKEDWNETLTLYDTQCDEFHLNPQLYQQYQKDIDEDSKMMILDANRHVNILNKSQFCHQS